MLFGLERELLFYVNYLFQVPTFFLPTLAIVLKIGDFGSAAKIKSQTTIFGEMQGFVGTQGKRIFIYINKKIT